MFSLVGLVSIQSTVFDVTITYQNPTMIRTLFDIVSFHDWAGVSAAFWSVIIRSSKLTLSSDTIRIGRNYDAKLRMKKGFRMISTVHFSSIILRTLIEQSLENYDCIDSLTKTSWGTNHDNGGPILINCLNNITMAKRISRYLVYRCYPKNFRGLSVKWLCDRVSTVWSCQCKLPEKYAI